MSFHQFHINEIYSNADGTIQFIEFVGDANKQNRWGPRTIVASSAVDENIFDIPGNLPSSATNGKSVLVATQGFANLGLVTPDYIIPGGFLFLNNGTVNFPGMDSLSYSLLPTDGTHSLNGSGLTINNSPTNFAGTKGTIPGNPIVGTSSSDTLSGTTASDFMVGLSGNDTLSGSDGKDTLNGDNGNDTLDGGIGNDKLNGGASNDVIIGGVGNDTIDGGTGKDTASYATATAGVRIYLDDSSPQNTEGAGTDRLISIENLTGSAFHDDLKGNSEANRLSGGEDHDFLDGGPGNDTIDGGNGRDSASYGSADKAVTVNLNLTTAQDTKGGGIDTLLNIESVTGSFFNDTLTGNGQANVIGGRHGNDKLYGGDGNDELAGGYGNDRVDGGAGNDTASYYGDVPGGVRVSLAITGAQNTVNAGKDTLVSIENLNGTAFDDTLTGNSAANMLLGLNGNDTLSGGSGNDTLSGGSGTDVLRGGAGGDTLSGSDGADRFDFDDVSHSGLTSEARDVITDFFSGEDTIDLSTIDANETLSGNQEFTFIGAASFSGDATGELRFDALNQLLLGSTNADAAAEFSILIQIVDSMGTGDFIL